MDVTVAGRRLCRVAWDRGRIRDAARTDVNWQGIMTFLRQFDTLSPVISYIFRFTMRLASCCHDIFIRNLRNVRSDIVLEI